VGTLPVPRATDIATPRVTNIEGTRTASGSGAIVLLVDDNLDLAGMLAELLRGWGHIVETKSSSQGALDAVQQLTPDVMLLDIGLPEIDGYELARRFRAMPQLDATTLIAMSGYGRPSDVRRSYAAGFAAHLVKPIDPTLLRQLLRRWSRSTSESAQMHV